MKLAWLFLAPLAFLAAAAPLSAVPVVIDHTCSEVEVDVKATLHSFTGRLKGYEVAIDADPRTGQIHRVDAHFAFAELVTGDAKRDHEMLEWEDARQYPDVTFNLIALELASPGKFTARGRLALHGVVREISFPVAVAQSGEGQFSIDGEVPLDTREFALPVIRKFGFLKVNPNVTVRFHLQGSCRST